jgi:hypothetical protein
MPLKVTKHNDTMEDHGDDLRLERDWRPQPDGTYQWTVFERKSTGLQLKSAHKSAKGNPEGPGVTSHMVEHIQEPGMHPVHKVATGLSHVWMPVFKGSEHAARMRLRTMAEDK